MPGFVADTVFDVKRGYYSAPVNVHITCATPGAQIRYTTNRTEPTAASTLYTGPLTLQQPGTIRARVYSNGSWSAVTEAFFSVATEPARP